MRTLRDSILELVSGFSFKNEVSKKERQAITVWVRPEDRLRYDMLQVRSGRTFSRLIQSTVRETIKIAEQKEKELTGDQEGSMKAGLEA